MTSHDTGSTGTPDTPRATAPPACTFGPQGPTLGELSDAYLQDYQVRQFRSQSTARGRIGRTTRSLEDPRAIAVTLYRGAFRYPDAIGRDVRFIALSDGQMISDTWVCVVEGQILIAFGCDNGGVHWNSTILSHAFYLAIEGGQNRTTGRTVQGVGGANRHDVERAFFRAMTHLMPARTTFPLTAAVIRQSAVDLFGAGSAIHRAVDQALYAVGL